MPDARFTDSNLRSIERQVASMPFTEPKLLRAACMQTYGSLSHGLSQQGLAIIGDGIVNERISKHLGVHWPNRVEVYHQIRAHYYSNGHMAEVIIAHGLDELLHPHEDHSVHALGTLFEALIGAMWLNDGDRGPTAFIWRTILQPIETELRTGHRPRYVPPVEDAVRTLKIMTIRMYGVSVTFHALHNGHDGHSERNCTRLEIPERYSCSGSGENCAAARQHAARQALMYLNSTASKHAAVEH